jgi:putative phosphoesterase
MKIGVISDTHGLLRPEAVDRLTGVDHILHAGDIGSAEVIDRLRALAPVTAIKGNNDTDDWASSYPNEARVTLGGRTIFILHDVKELGANPSDKGYDVVVSGHSHKPKIETKDGVLYLNPGSAGPRRFKLPITVAILEIGVQIAAEIHEII